MKRSRFSEQHIATALQQLEAGAPIAEVTRALGISEATYRCGASKVARWAFAKILRQLEEENRKHMQLVGDLTLDKVNSKGVLATKP